MKSDSALSPGEYVIFEVCFLDEELPELIACLFLCKQQNDSVCNGNFLFPELGRCITFAEMQQRDYCNRNSHLLTQLCYTSSVVSQASGALGIASTRNSSAKVGLAFPWCRDSATLTSVSTLATPNPNW